MDLDLVRAFVVVARAGGFAAAGRELDLPRSTLSRQLMRLEDELGVRLLERTTRAVRLTEAGETYLQRCGHAFDLIQAASRGARDSAKEPRGVLRVTASIDIARELLAPVLPELRRRYPALELIVDISQRQVDLVREGFDVALRGGARLRDSSLVARKLAEQVFQLYASPAYLARAGVPKTPAELAQHDLVAFAPGMHLLAWELVGPDGAFTLTPRAWLGANEVGFLRSALVGGLGIGLCDPLMTGGDVRDGRLQPVLREYRMSGGTLWAVYPSSRRVPAKVRALLDVLEAHLRGFGA